jgi:hypothetical protein
VDETKMHKKGSLLWTIMFLLLTPIEVFIITLEREFAYSYGCSLLRHYNFEKTHGKALNNVLKV